MRQHPVKRSRQSRPPGFLWQGLLILVPVFVLAALGAGALWRDRQSVEREATARAEELAGQIAHAIWNEVQQIATETNRPDWTGGDNREHRLVLNSFGQLVHPLLYDAVPLPQALNVEELSDEQRAFWERPRATFGSAGSTNESGDPAAPWQSFLASSPPSNFAAVAHYSLGLLLASDGRKQEAREQFAILTEQYPTATSEAGLPLSVMAGFRALMIERPLEEREIEQTFRRALEMPSAFTPQILMPDSLDRLTAGVSRIDANDPFRELWERVRLRAAEQWRDHERLRLIYNAARPSFRRGAAFELSPANGPIPISSLQQSIVPPVLSWVTIREGSARAEQHAFSEARDRRARRSEHAAFANESPSDGPLRSEPAEPRARETDTTFAPDRESLPLTVLDTPESPRRIPGLPNPARRSPESKLVVVSISTNSPLFIEPRDGSHWLLLRAELDNGYALHCLPSERVRQLVDQAVQRAGLPQYFDASVRLAEREVISTNNLRALEHVVSGKGGGQFWRRTMPREPLPVLARFTFAEGGEPLLAVAVHLISREMLFEQQRARAMSFLLVIGAAMTAAFAGFIGAWRAFRKQVRLAEMKSNFVSSVSHELRAPIASVRLMAEGLERGKIAEPAKQQEYFRFIVQECRRLSSMVENVLDFARIEQGRKQYEFETADLRALAEQTVALMQPYAAERDVRLSFVAAEVTRLHSTSGEPPASDDQSLLTSPATTIDMDAAAIQQALVNLIDNAIKHSPAGSEVLVELALAPPPQSTIHHSPFTITARLSVTDRGPGIPAEEHARIFERFHRLGSELRRETPGVGIGLSIVKHIVEAHGGRVFVESEIGKGSRFTIELPLSAEMQKRGEAP